jgi:hypothetical protein
MEGTKARPSPPREPPKRQKATPSPFSLTLEKAKATPSPFTVVAVYCEGSRSHEQQ